VHHGIFRTHHGTGGAAMHRRISTILNSLRQDLAAKLGSDFIHDACRLAGHTWDATCLLTPAATIHWLLIQVLNGNTALNHVSLLAGCAFTASALCQARTRLPLAVFQTVLRGLVKALVPDTEAVGRWRGHRTFLLDGSSVSMPDTPELQAHFGQPGNQAKGCGFPVAHLLVLFHAGTGLLLEVLTAPLRSHDMSGITAILPLLLAGDVLVADRGFCSFAHLALLMAQGAHGVFRLHQKQIVDFTPGRAHARPGQRAPHKGMARSRWIRAYGLMDQVVEYFKPAKRPGWMSVAEYAALPESIVVRELRYRITAAGFRTREVTLVTTLLDAEAYPADALAELYMTRWRVEENLKSLKCTMKMDVLKCKTVDGVHKELTMYAIAYNLVRLTMGKAAVRQGVEPDRVSFIDALRWLGCAEEGEEMPELVVNPDRPGRYEPRVKKRRPKPYPWMKKPRAELRKMLRDKDLAA
jgi:Transposase DDE domain